MTKLTLSMVIELEGCSISQESELQEEAHLMPVLKFYSN